MPLAAFIATTTQLRMVELDSDLPTNEHPAPVTANDTAPAPEPPVVLKGIGTPTLLANLVVEIAIGSCGFAAKAAGRKVVLRTRDVVTDTIKTRWKKSKCFITDGKMDLVIVFFCIMLKWYISIEN